MVLRAFLVRAILAALLLSVGHAFANTESSKCTARNSVPATVPEIAANPAKFDGRCVAVNAVTDGIYFFESVDGVYLRPPERLNPASSGFRIGVENLKSPNRGTYRHV